MKTFTKLGLAIVAAITFSSTDALAQISTANVTINTASVAPTGIFAKIGSVDTLSSCSGTPVSLSVNGGSLGTNASWNWYIGGIEPEKKIGTGASIMIDTTNSGLTNKILNIYVRAEGGTCAPANSDTAHLAFTILPLPGGNLASVTYCEGEEYELTFTANTPAANGPFDLNVFFNETSDITGSHVYNDIVSGTPFTIHSIQAPTVTGPNAYNLMEITDAKGCKTSALID